MNKKEGRVNWPVTIGIIMILAVLIFVACIFLQGETKTTGNWPKPYRSESLTCNIEGAEYPFFKYDNSKKKTTKINVEFENDNLNIISLVYLVYYDDSDQIIKSEAENHAAMNLKIQAEGLGSDALGANYARLKDSFKMSLYATKKDLNINTVKYFELDWIESGIYDLATTKAIYEEKGFVCIAN